ncbi:MAG TPA: hypothetical protein VH475_09705 [Tepidisphaeraceae bacterium]|jgi:hypothetical protein
MTPLQHASIAPLLAISNPAATFSLIAQLAAILAAAALGRFALHSRPAIWLVAFTGATAAMIAHIAVDGQGAFALLVYTPVIYLAATAGRRNLDHRRDER